MFIIDSVCQNPGILRIVLTIMNIVKLICIIAPIILILMLVIDIGKNVLSGDQEEIKKNLNKSIKRIIACILIFFVPLLVNVTIGFLGDLGVNYIECIENANSDTIDRLEAQRASNQKSGGGSSNNNNEKNSEKEKKNSKKYSYKFEKDLIVLGHYHGKSISKKKIAIYNDKGKRASNKKFTFKTGKPIATISENGVIEALFAGTTYVTATLNKDPSFKIKFKLVILKGTYTKVQTRSNVVAYNLETGKREKIPEGTDGIYNGSAMDLPQAHKRVIYYHGDILKVGNNYYDVPYTSVKAYQYSISNPYSPEIAEEFINSNNFDSATKHLFWISLGSQENYLFKWTKKGWRLTHQFDINTGDVLGLNPGSNGGNCDGSTQDSIYATGLGQCNSVGNTKVDAGHLDRHFTGSWLHVSYAVHTSCDSGSGYCTGTFHEGFSTPKRPKSHGCVRHTSDTMRWIKDHMNELGGSRIVNF